MLGHQVVEQDVMCRRIECESEGRVRAGDVTWAVAAQLPIWQDAIANGTAPPEVIQNN
jgi:hypothetical protein